MSSIFDEIGYSIKDNSPVKINGKKFYCMRDSEIFKFMLYRFFYVFANYLEIPCASYKFTRDERSYILYSESFLGENEVLLENELYDECGGVDNLYPYYDEIILSKLSSEEAVMNFYKQLLFSLAILDIDINIGIIKNKKTNKTQLTPYYDFGGVIIGNHMVQDEGSEIALSCYYVQEEKEALMQEADVTSADIQRDFEMIFTRDIINSTSDQTWITFYLEKLADCIRVLDSEFIDRVLLADVDAIMDSDTEYEYPENFRVVVRALLLKSRNLLRDSIEEINSQKNT